MTRILADIPDADIDRLDALARQRGRSRAAEIRDAVKAYLAHQDRSDDWIDRWAGLWADRVDIGDGVAFQRATRGSR